MDVHSELEKYKSAFQQSCLISESLTQINTELQEKLEILNGEHLRWQTENDQLKRENARKLAQQKQEMQLERQTLIDQLRIEHAKAIHKKDEEIKQIRGQLERIFEKPDSISPEHQQKVDREKIVELQTKIEEMTLSFNQALTEKEMDKKVIKDWEMKYQLLDKRREAIKNSADKINADLQVKVQKLEQEKQESESKYQQLHSAKQNLENLVLQFQNENTTLISTVEALSNLKTQYETELSELRSQKLDGINKEADNDEIFDQSHSHNNKGKEILQEREFVENQYAKENSVLESENENLKTHITELKTELSELRKELAAITPLKRNQQEQTPTPEEKNGSSILSYFDNELHSNATPLDLQKTIAELQQQCDSFRNEIFQRNENHQQIVTDLKRKNQQFEQLFTTTTQSYLHKFQSYSETISILQNQIETIQNNLIQQKNISDQFTILQDQYQHLQSQFTTVEQELQAHKQLLIEERKKLETSKEIACDLRNHITELNNINTTTTNELEQLREDFDKLQVELVQQKKAFEHEKTTIIYDLLQKQIDESDGTDDNNHDEHHVTHYNHSQINTKHHKQQTPSQPYVKTPNDERKAISNVKKKLIDELWKETYEMLEVSPKY